MGEIKKTVLAHKVTTIWVTWTLCIITYAVAKAFGDPSAINAQTVAALGLVIGLPPAFVALWKLIQTRKP
jgi:hypothetical protein